MSGGTVERARHRWREILPQLGVETRFLTKKHGPCPLCGGKDRFRFDDRNGEGSYYCNQCGSGAGLMLLRKLHGWDHKTACDAVDKIIDGGPSTPAPAAAPQDVSSRRATAIERALAEAVDDDVVETYLTRRGIAARSPVLRGHRRCPYFDDDRRFVGCFPAVLAPIIGPGGTLRSALRIYDADVTPRKKVMPPVDMIRGSAVQLFEPLEELGVAEGVETALAARELFGAPIWSCLTATGIKSFEPPAGVRRLVVFGDNDHSYTGQEAAYALAKRLRSKGLNVEIHIPEIGGTDWLDVLNARGQP